MSISANLSQLGFSYYEAEAKEYQNLFPARITEQHRNIYKLMGDQGSFQGVVSGKLNYSALLNENYPVVGDWVLVDRENGQGGDAVIHQILTRKSQIKRKAAGPTSEAQVIAANIDYVFICMSLNQNFNVRRLERYITMVWDSGAVPVVVLTKADLSEDTEEKLLELETVAAGIDIIVTSSVTGQGNEALMPYLEGNRTVAFLGSSGVGKSSLINYLIGQETMEVSGIRGDGRGRHTTTHRQLMVLPQGGVVIDTPGMRTVLLDSGDLAKAFTDIDGLASQCKFSDCEHENEPGCAVCQAIEDGTLDPERLDSYRKLKREQSYNQMNSRQMEDAKIKKNFGSKQQMKSFMREIKQKNKRR